MTMRTLVAVVLTVAGVLAIGWWRAPVEGPAERWVVARDLQRNHQLEAGDLSGPLLRHRRARLTPIETMVGKHLIVPKHAGDSISVADLAATTRFAPGQTGSRVAIYQLKSEAYLSLAIPQGAWVVPCYVRAGGQPMAEMATKCSRDPLLVEAIHRPTTPADDSWIALRIPRCHSGVLGEYLSQEHRFLMVAPTNPAASPPAGVGR